MDPRKLPDPKMPSKEEVEEHYLTHLPYRSWCQLCVQGNGVAPPHFKQKKREDGLTETHFDYCFMSTHGSPMATVLVAREQSTRMTLATVVPLQGGSIEFPARRTLLLKRNWPGRSGCGIQIGSRAGSEGPFEQHCEQTIGDIED